MTSYGQPGTAVLVLRSRPRRALRTNRGGGEAQRQGGCGASAVRSGWARGPRRLALGGGSYLSSHDLVSPRSPYEQAPHRAEPSAASLSRRGRIVALHSRTPSPPAAARSRIGRGLHPRRRRCLLQRAGSQGEHQRCRRARSRPRDGQRHAGFGIAKSTSTSIAKTCSNTYAIMI